ncbi:MAG TPA: FAD-dependent oxidoreductase [Bacteroidales bacterium]|nr:FAD-dependent oxidoreductase [Bacteroidales bacterium]
MINLKNKFIMAPLKLGYAHGDGLVNEKHLFFYEKRSNYLGAIILEPLYLDSGLREIPTQLGIDNDDKIPGLSKLVNVLHKNGVKAIAHLNHPGRMANPNLSGNYFISSTNKPCENGGAVPEMMDREMMDNVINNFVEATQRAVHCGFDMIELQFGHGYLLAQFLSPSVNNRSDNYNGTLENRAKFPLEVLNAVKKAVEIPLIARISGDEMITQGFHIDEMIQFSLLLKKNGIEAIHVSAGSSCSTPPWFFQHMFVPKGRTWELAGKIKSEVKMPVIFVGQVNTIKDIQLLEQKYHADYIALGRALVADPDFLGKFFGLESGNIRPCLACSEGCLGGVKSGQGLQCLVNPEAGRETEVFEITKQAKQFAIIGGGLSGMEAAIILKRRGHNVDLFEKNKLGGQFNLAPLTPNKKSMGRLVPYFVEELKNNGINIIYREVIKSDIMGKYDGVIFATGSKPKVPSIAGLNKYYWADILLEENIPENKKILIIGGGLIGVDIATALIALNNKVIIVKRTTDFGEDMEMIAKNLSLKMMKEKGTVFSDHTNIKKIEGKTVFAEKNGENIQFEDIDTVVVSTGMESYIPFKPEFKIPVYYIGDAKSVGKAQNAIYDAYKLALTL